MEQRYSVHVYSLLVVCMAEIFKFPENLSIYHASCTTMQSLSIGRNHSRPEEKYTKRRASASMMLDGHLLL
jgi:hypothetical protein